MPCACAFPPPRGLGVPQRLLTVPPEAIALGPYDGHGGPCGRVCTRTPSSECPAKAGKSMLSLQLLNTYFYDFLEWCLTRSVASRGATVKGSAATPPTEA